MPEWPGARVRVVLIDGAQRRRSPRSLGVRRGGVGHSPLGEVGAMDASDYQDTDDFNKMIHEAAITVQDTVRRKKDELVQTGTPTSAAMPQVGGKLQESERSAEEDARRLEQRSPRSDRSRPLRVERAPTMGIVAAREEKKKKAVLISAAAASARRGSRLRDREPW